jgi:hypothetical protein
MEDLFVGIFIVIATIALVACFGLILAFPIMWCWNYTMPAIFHLPTITWGQSWCLNFLAGCLIKSTLTSHK